MQNYEYFLSHSQGNHQMLNVVDEKITGTDKKNLLLETLKRRVISMDLKPGSSIDEMTLCEEFSLSRSPVRELIRQLASEGYLELEANRGARVATMSYQSLRNFFLASPLIYTATSQLAATNATNEDIACLKEIQKNFKEAIAANNLEDRVYLNNRFHHEIGRIARNPYLMPTLERVLIDHARLGNVFYKAPATHDMNEDLQKAVDQHDAIIDAIEQHNVVKVSELIKAHMDLSRQRMTEYVVPTPLDLQIDF